MTEYSDDQITSKGQQKREDNALQELGLLLMDMKQVERERLPLRDDLQYALVEATRITSHELAAVTPNTSAGSFAKPTASRFFKRWSGSMTLFASSGSATGLKKLLSANSPKTRKALYSKFWNSFPMVTASSCVT